MDVRRDMESAVVIVRIDDHEDAAEVAAKLVSLGLFSSVRVVDGGAAVVAVAPDAGDFVALKKDG